MSLYYYLIAASTVLLQAGQGYAAAVKRAVRCEEVSTYTVDYFMNHKTYEPPASTCLFYTAFLSTAAQLFERSCTGLTTIWNMWPCNLYNGDTSDDNNPLRCIFDRANRGDTADRTTYFEHMSEAMATSCDVFTTVMTRDTDSIPKDGIWGRIEEPALQQTGNPGGQVDTIIAIDENGNNLKTVWERGQNTQPLSDNSSSDSDDGNGNATTSGKSHCYAPEQIETWFGDVPW